MRHLTREKQGTGLAASATSGRRLESRGRGAQVEDCALNVRSNMKLNKPSPRRRGRQMEQRKKSNELQGSTGQHSQPEQMAKLMCETLGRTQGFEYLGKGQMTIPCQDS